MKGILFKPDMIQAIVEGRKTQTRRLNGLREINQEPDRWKRKVYPDGSELFEKDNRDLLGIQSRYQVGDIVYIKEAWSAMAIFDNRKPSELDDNTPIWFADTDGDVPTNCADDKGRLRSPMFLESRFARLFIKITDVKVERLQSISIQDCLAEGIHGYTFARGVLAANPPDPRWAYQELWDSINKKQKWETNPWCFVYSFVRQERPI